MTFTEEKYRIDAIRYLLQKRYPADHFGIETTLFKLGRDGRNSFRTDFAVYDRPFDDVRGKQLEKRLEHLRVLAEIKRDNSSAETAKATQVKAALQLVPATDTLGVYWDDVEQRFFYRNISSKRAEVLEAPINKIPDWGNALDSTQLFYADLEPARDLVRIFDDIEDALHPYVADKVQRYALIQQLLLAKIHDETTHRANRQDRPLLIQDFSAAAITELDVMRRMDAALKRAASHYNVYLPQNKGVGEDFRCPPEALRNATRILAPINVLKSKAQVIQAFYMKFAMSLYKWDLAQYFTPHEVIDFIVDLANPQAGEHVFDPACGSADFLVSAFRKVGSEGEHCVWGADNSEQAVQISILNMVLNGDGKTQIKNHDSLQKYSEKSRKFEVVLCNPPFGTKIVERRYEVLRKFDMGHKWVIGANGAASRLDEVREKQQTGILFAEMCVKQALPGGRIGLILPNGYLGNRGAEYQGLREWLLRETRLVAVVAFPRFTFKKSGADVSASVVLLEKRKTPLKDCRDSKEYAVYFGNIQSVGWRAGDKTAEPIYVQDEKTGEMLLDAANEPILDADFNRIYDDFAQSPARDIFPWVLEGKERSGDAQTTGVPISEILATSDLNIDPKRYSNKFRSLRDDIRAKPHFMLGDVLDVVKEPNVKREATQLYRYVEIENVAIGGYDHDELRGWQLPDRARLPAKPGDIFVAHIWSSAGKWFVAAGDCENTVVTNGCTRLRLKPNCQQYMVDLAVGLCSEAFAIQMRGFATGSDGLAEIGDNDMLKIVLPKVTAKGTRQAVEERLKAALEGESTFEKFITGQIKKSASYPSPAHRRKHWELI